MSMDLMSAVCRKALALDSKSGAAYAEMGTILHRQGRDWEAAEALERAVALVPKNARARSLMGVVYGKLGRIQESILAFRRAQALNPNDADTWANLGVAYYQTRRLEEAEEAFRQAQALEPDNPTAKSGLGVFYQKRGKIETALRLFREVLEVEPKNVQTLLNLASVAYETGDLEESLSQDLQAILAGQVTEIGGPKAVAEILNRTGRSTEKAVLERLDAQDPELAEDVRNQMFVFDDIANLTDREIQLILREVDSKDLSTALKGANDEMKDRIFANVSERVGTMMKEEMDFSGPVRMSDVEEVQLRVVQTVRQLEEAGQVTIVRGDSNDQFV